MDVGLCGCDFELQICELEEIVYKMGRAHFGGLGVVGFAPEPDRAWAAFEDGAYPELCLGGFLGCVA